MYDEEPGEFGMNIAILVSLGMAVLASAAVLALTRDALAPEASTLLSAASLVPGGTLGFFVIYPVVWRKQLKTRVSNHGITLAGVCYAEAVVLGMGAPYFGAEEGEPFNWGIILPAWALAIAFVWAGRRLTLRRRRRDDMAKLAGTNVNLATRFLVRPDKKGCQATGTFDPLTTLKLTPWSLGSVALLLLPAE
jgi:hypothetical protein